MQKLTATGVKQAKPKAKPFKLSDGGGLYLYVMPRGKYWRYKYRYARTANLELRSALVARVTRP